ncbi:prostasin-like protein, partial [Aphelenchoides avenae]
MLFASVLLFLAVGITGSLQEPDCGRNPRIGMPEKVIGGHVAADGNWPWAVCVETPIGCCSGSVISPGYVLSAAHCVHGLE